MKKLLFLWSLAILAIASIEDEKIILQKKVLQYNALQQKYIPIMRSVGDIYSQLQPPTTVNQHFVLYFNESALLYLWYQNGKNFIRVFPTGEKFFTCSASFKVIQNGIQHRIQLLQKEDGPSFCDELYTPTTFRIAPYSFDNFDDTVPINDLIYKGYVNGDKIYHLSAEIIDGEVSNNNSFQTCESQVLCGKVEDYTKNTENLPGAPKIVYPKEVVDQIIENKLSKCRQDPKSCGINAIPIITTKSDPNKVINQIKNKEFSINGHYIHYGEGSYDWIYVPSSLKHVLKLEKGTDENYNLRWLLINGVKATKNGDKITFTTP
ncbi:hypothetical protein NitYY0826_C0240 [Nitratiruptor sp. YY08-26]|uniref:hypothetical protein n=1 Tax=unclassified Nitratiruptor TaxID=2624044 RepID=UPI0019168852|nr:MULTISPECIES: hypothetical protein [unclassified Nitratiruptor]BCD61395.1 hypothetical protein NitYY0813_C0239 [Nitratiruptor sp. YY08-13]BCD65329.1 hypothetical protein NitYY0826_C0240 [Nitratiruptor sp. YY08-26]